MTGEADDRVAELKALLKTHREERDKQATEIARLEAERDRAEGTLEHVLDLAEEEAPSWAIDKHQSFAPDDAICLMNKRIARLEAENARYQRLRAAVNADRDCLPECDKVAHADDCPVVNTAKWVEDLQERAEAAERDLKSLGELHAQLEDSIATARADALREAAGACADLSQQGGDLKDAEEQFLSMADAIAKPEELPYPHHTHPGQPEGGAT